MMRFSSLALVVCLCCPLGSCRKNPASGTPDQAATSSLDPALEPATAAEFERLLLSLASCQVRDSGRASGSCPEEEQYMKFLRTLDVRRQRRPEPKTLELQEEEARRYRLPEVTLALKHLKHPAPQVRFAAALLLRFFHKYKPEALDTILEAARTEKQPDVLRALLIDALGSRAGAHPPVQQLLLANVDHADERIRYQCLAVLMGERSREVPGLVDKLIEKMDKDPSPKVRHLACVLAGRTGAADRLIPVLERLTKSADDAERYSGCMTGLVNLLRPYPGWSKPPSPAAYALLMARLRDKPRSMERPPRGVIVGFGDALKGKPSWAKRAEIVEVLADIALDEKTHAPRFDSVTVLGDLKAVEQLKQIKSKLAGKTAINDRNVVRAVDEALAKVN